MVHIMAVDEEPHSTLELTAIIHDKLSTDVENEIMNLAEQIKEEGEIELLANGVEPAFVAKNTGFPNP